MDRRAFLTRTSQAALAVGILRHAGACRRAPGGGPLARLREEYFLDSLRRNPVTSTYLGGDGYNAELTAVNGRLRDYSPEALADEVMFYREVTRRLEAMDETALDAAERVDRGVMLAQSAYLLRQLDGRRYHQRCVDTYVAEPFRGVDWLMQQMTDAGGGLLGTAEEWELLAQRVEAIPAYLRVAAANLQAGVEADNRPDWRMVQFDGITAALDAAEFFGTTLTETARGYLGGRGFATTAAVRLDAAGRGAGEAFKTFADVLDRTLGGSDRADRYAAGEEEYAWRVRYCLQDPRSPAELWDYGAEQVALYEQAMFDVAREVATAAGLGLSFGSDTERRAGVRAVMEHLSGESPRDDDELFRWYREAADRAVAYGREHALFDIPADYRLDSVPTPPVLRSTIGAAYYPAPPFKRSGVGRFYLTPTGDDPAALRENNHASVADTAVHEGFPGHDWHFKYMTQHAAEISSVRWLTPGAVEDSFSMWEDSMATEGWGLYSEELMAQQTADRPYGFFSPAEYLYELQGQLLRAVRVRVDVGIHTGRMTMQEAVDYFAAHVSFVPDACARARRDATARAVCEGARRSLYRYSKWPTQAITYNLGKNAIVGLREAVRAKQGAAFSAQAFHERFMRMGTIPAGFFRETFLAAS